MTLKHNVKQLFEMINNVTRKTKNQSCIVDKISVENIASSDSKVIASSLNNYFSSVGKKVAKKISNGSHYITYYLYIMSRNQESVYFYLTNEIEIDRIISNMVNKTRSGYDGTSNKLLKSLRMCSLNH